MKELLTELNEYFPDTFIHMGGDEVTTNCFDIDPTTKDFL